MSEQQQSTEAVSLDTIVRQADDMVGAARTRTIVDLNDPISALREHCMKFIEAANLNQHTRMQALPKVDEMIFWIRAGAGKG